MQQSNQILQPWVRKLFEAIDGRDATAFASFFTDDGVFTWASFPPAQGRAAVEEAARQFFASLKAIRHEVLRVDCVDNLIYLPFISHYEVEGKGWVTLKGVNVYVMDDKKIKDYTVYMDPTPLLTLQAEDS